MESANRLLYCVWHLFNVWLLCVTAVHATIHFAIDGHLGFCMLEFWGPYCYEHSYTCSLAHISVGSVPARGLPGHRVCVFTTLHGTTILLVFSNVFILTN